MHKVISTMRAREGRADELLQAAEALAQATQAETGVQSYQLWQAVNDERTIIFDEVWHSVDAWRQHTETPYLKAFKAETADLVEDSEVIAARPRVGVA